jgi:hypothetical protein
MKKVIALSIGLAFSAGAIAQEQVKAASTMEKTQSIVKDIVHFAKNNNAPTTTSTALELKPTEAPKVEAKVETKIDSPKIDTKDVKPIVVKEEPVKQGPKVKAIKIEKETTEVKKTEVKPVVVAKVDTQVKKEEVCIDPVVKKPIAKKIVKKTKKVVKPIEKIVETKPVTNQVQNAALLEADYYYIPKHATLEQYPLFAKPISYDDVELQVNNKGDDISVSLTDKRIDKPLDAFYLAKPVVTVLNVTTDLDKKEPVEIQYDESDAYEISFDNKDGCRVIFFEFQLNNQEESRTVAKFIDSNGNFVNKVPTICKANTGDSKDTTFYTPLGNIINIGFSQKQSADKGVGMQVHFVKEGHEFTPYNLKAFAVARDFSTFYTLNTKTNAKGPYFGMDVSRKVPTGSYFIFIGHEQGNKVEWVKTSMSVQ